MHTDVVDEFGRLLAERMSQMPVGRGVEEGSRIGPRIDQAAQDKVQALVEDAVAKGAEVIKPGQAPVGDGYFYPPTVLTGVPETARMRHEEIFGPVAPLSTFTTEAEVIAAANDTQYGLVNYVYTNDLSCALRVADALEGGMVGLNQGVVSNPAAPFGGVKASGLGREGGPSGIDEFLETKYIGITLPDPAHS